MAHVFIFSPESFCRRHRNCLGRIVELEELADFAVAEFVEVGFRRFEDFARAFIFEGDVAECDHALALGDVVVDFVIDHLLVGGESGEIMFDVVFAI
jgi:putative hemolysin